MRKNITNGPADAVRLCKYIHMFQYRSCHLISNPTPSQDTSPTSSLDAFVGDWLCEPWDPQCNIQLQTSFFKPQNSFTYPVLDCVPYLPFYESTFFIRIFELLRVIIQLYHTDVPPFFAKNANAVVLGEGKYFYFTNPLGILCTILWTKWMCIAMKIQGEL